MMSRLPAWVEIGGFWLAAVAGAVNAIGLLGFKHQAVSHLTGTSTLLGLSLVGLDVPESAHLAVILVSFLLGAALSGVVIDGVALRLGRGYAIALLVEAGLLLLAMVALGQGSTAGHYLASAACGLQNGMVSTYSGAVVRTTHVSGLFTDLGVMLGGWVRGRPPDRRKAILYLLLIAGFIAGGAAGAVGFRHLQFVSLTLPAFGAAGLAAAYWLYRHRHNGEAG